jgi:hypothetical protein
MASNDLQEAGLWRIREHTADGVSVALEGTIAAGGVDRTAPHLLTGDPDYYPVITVVAESVRVKNDG